VIAVVPQSVGALEHYGQIGHPEFRRTRVPVQASAYSAVAYTAINLHTFSWLYTTSENLKVDGAITRSV